MPALGQGRQVSRGARAGTSVPHITRDQPLPEPLGTKRDLDRPSAPNGSPERGPRGPEAPRGRPPRSRVLVHQKTAPLGSGLVGGQAAVGSTRASAGGATGCPEAGTSDGGAHGCGRRCGVGARRPAVHRAQGWGPGVGARPGGRGRGRGWGEAAPGEPPARGPPAPRGLRPGARRAGRARADWRKVRARGGARGGPGRAGARRLAGSCVGAGRAAGSALAPGELTKPRREGRLAARRPGPLAPPPRASGPGPRPLAPAAPPRAPGVRRGPRPGPSRPRPGSAAPSRGRARGRGAAGCGARGGDDRAARPAGPALSPAARQPRRGEPHRVSPRPPGEPTGRAGVPGPGRGRGGSGSPIPRAGPSGTGTRRRRSCPARGPPRAPPPRTPRGPPPSANLSANGAGDYLWGPRCCVSRGQGPSYKRQESRRCLERGGGGGGR